MNPRGRASILSGLLRGGNLVGTGQLYQVANKASVIQATIGNGTAQQTGAQLQAQRRYRFTLFGAGSRIKIRMWNATSSAGPIGNGPTTLTYRGALWVNSATQIPYTFNGARDIVLAPGDIAESDWINVTWSGSPFVFSQDLFTWAVAQTNYPVSNSFSPTGAGNRQSFSTTASLPDRTLTDWNSGSALFGTANLFPLLDVVTDSPQTIPGVLILGDSTTSDGAGDNGSGGEFHGWAERGLAHQRPWVQSGVSGLRLTDSINYPGALTMQKAQRIDPFLNRGFKYVFLGVGGNDIGDGGQAVYDYALAAKAIFDAAGMKMIMKTNLPRATDNTNTTPRTGQQILDFNALVRANNGVGYGYFDGNLYAYDPANPMLWRTDLGSPTTDGVHPTTVIHQAVGNAFNAAVPTLFP